MTLFGTLLDCKMWYCQLRFSHTGIDKAHNPFVSGVPARRVEKNMERRWLIMTEVNNGINQEVSRIQNKLQKQEKTSKNIPCSFSEEV